MARAVDPGLKVLRSVASAKHFPETMAIGVSKMPTGKKPASDAGKILSDPRSTKKEKEVEASDLAQSPRKKK